MSFSPAIATTINWLRGRFSDYYVDNPCPLPDRFTRREFGFILWPEKPGPPPFLRHRSFRSGNDLHSEMIRRGPHSAYYSTAYYRRPGEARMADKEWLGAELIFDLDADHLQAVEAAKAAGSEMAIADQLAQVKEQFKRLLDEFLLGDLGIDEKDLWITFSGGRGYHCHVTDPRFVALDNKARREIVDYITGKVPTQQGTDLPDLDVFIQRETIGMRGRGEYAKAMQRERLPSVNAYGWQGRITRSLVSVLRVEVMDKEPKDAIRFLTGLQGIGQKGAQDLVDKLDETMLARISEGYLEQGNVVKRVCHHILRQSAIPMARGETDEPVTADVKRLIRLPGSLHGKTGLSVVVLTRDEVDDFEPLRDAVAFSQDLVRIKPRISQTVTLGGKSVAVTEAEEIDIPEAHAVWILARQGGTIVLD